MVKWQLLVGKGSIKDTELPIFTKGSPIFIMRKFSQRKFFLSPHNLSIKQEQRKQYFLCLQDSFHAISTIVYHFCMFTISDINKISSADFSSILTFGSLIIVTLRSTILTTRFCLFEVSTKLNSRCLCSRERHISSGSWMRISAQEY